MHTYTEHYKDTSYDPIITLFSISLTFKLLDTHTATYNM